MINLEWVSDYIDISDEDLEELAVKITKAGINVEKVISNHIDNLVIGEVVSCSDHPDSDHLHVCLVNVGSDKKTIVCGATNVREGIKVIVALPGAVLPGDFVIKPSRIRGVESNGMLCALYELGLEEKTEEAYERGICELPSDAKVGTDPLKYLGLEATLYELDIHKHRNNDCYYHIGFAYEIAAILGKKVTLPDDDFTPISDSVSDHFSLEVETDKCPYYMAGMVKDIKIGESPEFIKKRLAAAGMRSINNVVDISNYVMLEYGQPLHFFDKEKLGDRIVVRDAHDGEEITTLDGNLRKLTDKDIVITDGTKSVCVAGVMGGENTEVDDNTTTILIESAIFDPISIRNIANRLNLRSEASIRYGKGLNYEYTQKAMARACHLLEKYASAKVLSGNVLYDKIDKSEKKVKFSVNDINKMLGITISEEDMERELDKLDFAYEVHDDIFEVVIPRRRLDIDSNVNDIAEEIGRLYGYHNLVSTLPVTTVRKGSYIGDVKYRKLVSKRLRTLGLNEAKTYTLVSPSMADTFKYQDIKNVVLPNPMSVDKSVVRTTLIPSLLKVYEYNKARGIDDIFLYEISKVYDSEYNEDSKITILMSGNYISNNWQGNVIKTDFYLIKGIICNLLDYLGLKNRYDFTELNTKDMHPFMSAKVILDRECVGIMGRVHPNVSHDDIYVAEVSMNALMKKIKPIKFKASSRYPSISKDMAFIVDADVKAFDIFKTIRATGGRLLTSIDIFDVYTGDGIASDKKSIAFSLLFENDAKTLTDSEVNEIFNKIIAKVESKHNAVLRDN